MQNLWEHDSAANPGTWSYATRVRMRMRGKDWDPGVYRVQARIDGDEISGVMWWVARRIHGSMEGRLQQPRMRAAGEQEGWGKEGQQEEGRWSRIGKRGMCRYQGLSVNEVRKCVGCFVPVCLVIDLPRLHSEISLQGLRE